MLRVQEVREHYDRLSGYYHRFWGEHIHHGYWDEGETWPAARAQERLIEVLAQRASLSEGDAALDIGCGLGGFTCWLPSSKTAFVSPIRG